ncbi:MAG: DUF2723 domain-containing protein [Candidatus Delongbacteria bacterium]|nr:DUF2723 domain-containing protein [Candidatus Delongbacteria bacterium]
MQDEMVYRESPWIRVGAPVLVFILALLGFVQTVQPTTSFWDCGEFIATSYILGVPHPPGAPTFNLIGRIFTMIPIGEEIAWRVNMLSVLSSAFAILFFYLIIREILKYLFPQTGIKDSLIAAGAAFTSSLMCAFSDTFWFNAVEGEVYGIAMFFLFLAFYLSLIWYRHRQESGCDRYLIMMFFVMFLGIGAHMFSLLFFPAVFILMILVDKPSIWDRKTWMGLLGFIVLIWIMNKANATYETGEVMISVIGLAASLGLAFWLRTSETFKNWHYWLAFFQLTLVIYALDIFIWLNAFALVIYLVLSFSSKHKEKFRFLLVAVLVSLIGYSTYIYVPIRSNLNPTIDENDPENWEQFKVFMERKQYGEPDIWSRITKRYGSWNYQFNYMINYLRTQFNNDQSARILFPIWLLVFMYGLYVLWRHTKNKHISLLLSLILVIALIGLVIYMNFSDGLHGKQAEVRDRDYFHVPSFMMFAMMLGVGLAGILRYIKDKLKLQTVAVGLCLPMCILPYMTFHQLKPYHDRSHDYMPNDYAHNILVCCPQNAILFTQGDNDTFPLWFIQEVKKFRKDVRVVNLSLLNAGWYIKQLKYIEPKLEFSLSDKTIDEQLVGAYPLDKDYPYRHGRIQTVLPRGSYIRVQDIGIMELIKSNYGKRPICFSITVGPDGRIGLEKYFLQRGMVYELIDTLQNGPVMDKEATEDLIVNQFKYTNLNRKVYLGKEGGRYVYSYAEGFDRLARTYLKEGNESKAVELWKKSIELLPYVGLSYYYLGNYYFERKDYDQAVTYYQLGKQHDESVGWFVNYYTAVAYRLSNRYDSAFKYIDMSINTKDAEQADDSFLREAISICIATGNKSKAADYINNWLKRNPNSEFARQLKGQLDILFTTPTAPAPTSDAAPDSGSAAPESQSGPSAADTVE